MLVGGAWGVVDLRYASGNECGVYYHVHVLVTLLSVQRTIVVFLSLCTCKWNHVRFLFIARISVDIAATFVHPAMDIMSE